MPIPQNPERLNFNIPLADFEIQVSKGNVEIVRRGKTYEMLTAYPDHPYCELAEGYFSEALAKHALDPNNKDICELHKNQKIKFYLRSQRELTVEEVYITGDIMQKKIGVQSGIIVQPQEFAGLICCPPKTAGDAWIVARPYDPRYLRSAKSEIREIPDIIPQHVMSLPNIRPAINLVDALNADEYRDINFQSPPAREENSIRTSPTRITTSQEKGHHTILERQETKMKIPMTFTISPAHRPTYGERSVIRRRAS